jgi:hypothetical protein
MGEHREERRVTIDFDPFAPGTDNKKYSPENFYTKAKAPDGSSTTLRYDGGKTNVPDFLFASVKQLIEAFPPYKCNDDVVRDALFHLIHLRYEQRRHDFPSWWQGMFDREFYKAEVERVANNWIQHDEALETIRISLHRAKTPQQVDEAVAACEQLAMTFEYPEHIRDAAELIDRFRR